ncbi:hypothetical protein [Caballeronia sp. HLA56]
MQQISLESNLSAKKTRKREIPDEMERVVLFKVPVQIIKPH